MHRSLGAVYGFYVADNAWLLDHLPNPTNSIASLRYAYIIS
jgi:hypothetical protein